MADEEECALLQPWLPCGKDGCCEEGKTSTGYSKADGPVSYCVEGVLMIATSLTDDKNCDTPLAGAHMVNPPTWSLQTMGDWVPDPTFVTAGANTIVTYNPDTNTYTVSSSAPTVVEAGGNVAVVYNSVTSTYTVSAAAPPAPPNVVGANGVSVVYDSGTNTYTASVDKVWLKAEVKTWLCEEVVTCVSNLPNC